MKRVSSPVSEVPRKRIATNGLALPNPIREGELLTDISQKTWKLGRSIGLGGFGEIYLASDNLTKPVSADAKYVIKVEPHKNGPLFVEMNFYIRAAKLEMIDSWMAKSGLSVLGIPYYVGSGSHYYKGERYRFLVLPRYCLDVEKVFLQQGHRFHIKTVFTLASYIMDSLQYIHDHEYIHADIKASNLMLGSNTQAPVYLLDFGLATRFLDREGKHKEYRHDERRAHDGTIEYTSRDAHIGVHSRRGDLEILGYNLVKWLTGRLPWEQSDLEPEDVHNKKIMAMKNITQFLKSTFAPASPPDALIHYLQYVANMTFESKPDYKYCKRLFHRGIYEAGFENDGKLTFANHQKRLKLKKKVVFESENNGVKPKKAINAPTRQPCVPKNVYRVTRNTANKIPALRSKSEFDWAIVLAGDPEKMLRKDRSVCLPYFKQDHISEDKPKVVIHNKKLMERMQSSQNCENVPEKLDNPTPEMIKVWNRMKQRVKEQQCNIQNKRSKSGSRCNSPTQNERELFTPAMEEVIRRRDPAPRNTRCSLRISGKSVISEFKAVKKNVPLITICRRTRRCASLKG